MQRLRAVREQLRRCVRSFRQNPSARMSAVPELPARLPPGANDLWPAPLGGGRGNVTRTHAPWFSHLGGYWTRRRARRAAGRVAGSQLAVGRGASAVSYTHLTLPTNREG